MKLQTRRGTNQYSQKMKVVNGDKYCTNCGVLNVPSYSSGAFPRPIYALCHNCGNDVEKQSQKAK